MAQEKLMDSRLAVKAHQVFLRARRLGQYAPGTTRTTKEILTGKPPKDEFAGAFGRAAASKQIKSTRGY